MLNEQQQQESIVGEKINTTADFDSSQFEQNVLIDTSTQNQPNLHQVPEWAQFIVYQQTAMAKTIAEQTKELKVQDVKLQLLQKLIEENEALKAQVADYKKKLQHFELQQQQTTVTPEDVTNNNSHDQDLLHTGTCESRHAISTEEWEQRKTEIEAAKKQQQQQDETKQLKQFKRLDQQTQCQQQLQQHASMKSYAKITSKNVAQKTKVTQPPSKKLINWAHRILTPTTDKTAYTFVYMGSPRLTLHSEIRKALRLVGVAQERVIDIQLPTHGIVALLIHSSYEKELRELLNQAKLSPKDNFDPTAATTIGDPMLLAKLSEDQRILEAKKIYQERMLAMCSRMPKKHLGIAILRHFTSLSKEDPHHVDSDYWTKFQEKNPKPPPRQHHLINSLDDARKLLSGTNDNKNNEPEQMEF